MTRLGETGKKKNQRNHIYPEEMSGVVLIHVCLAESLELADFVIQL